MAQLFHTLVLFVSLFASCILAVSPLVVQGSDFVNSVDGSRFQIIGVAYQPGGSSGFDPASGLDPLSNATVCLRDATLLQRLGVNTIRVYNLDPDLDHSACASIFNAAGIYMILDVNSPLPNQSLDRGAPWDSYNSAYLTRVFEVVEGFMEFNNTLGFFSGNEVINQDAAYLVPSYLRAVTRDIKDYISAQSPRPIPVGYSAADVDTLLTSSWEYLSCVMSNATSSNIDFFGLNSYSWCGRSSFQTSGYDVLVSDFGNTTTPIFFSEYGCNTMHPRIFTEVPVLYGPQMTPVFSGGLIYEYSQEVNNYGLVVINDDGSVNILQDYVNLQNQYDSLDASALEASNGTATSLKPPACAPSLIAADGFQNTFSLPPRPSGVDSIITNGVPNKDSYRKSFVDVPSTTPTQTVRDVNGAVLSGLKLKILANDESNLPGNNTSGTTPSTTTTSSTPTPTKKSAAVRLGDIRLGPLVLGTLALGFLIQL